MWCVLTDLRLADEDLHHAALGHDLREVVQAGEVRDALLRLHAQGGQGGDVEGAGGGELCEAVVQAGEGVGDAGLQAGLVEGVGGGGGVWGRGLARGFFGEAGGGAEGLGEEGERAPGATQ